MVGRLRDGRIIETANRHTNFVGIRRSHKRQRSSACLAELPKAARPMNLSRIPCGEPKVESPKGRPRDKRRAAAPATIFAMTVSDVIGRSAGFVPDFAAKAASLDRSWVHGRAPSLGK